MAKLIYTAIASLDGYIADASGNFDWSMPDEEVHAFVNDLERDVGTYLYGRRLYEVMTYWESLDLTGEIPVAQDYATIWRAADKIVYSSSLAEASSELTSIEREFDADAVRRLKETSKRDLSIGGPNLAAHAIAAGLVDEYRLLISPVIVGGGTRFLPDDIRLSLELIEERRFSNGVVYLRYRSRTGAPPTV